ncbi:MAG: type II secretion system protein N [Sterolibacterium sp.]|nr:type II secretion system protein N [Sterolibacterium sp.]
MRKSLGYGLLFLCLLLLAAISQWPAASLASLLTRISNDQWHLEAPTGTLWRGSGMLLARAGKNTPWRKLQNLHWQIHASELLHGRLTIRLTPEQGQLLLVARPAGLQIEDIDLRLPAETIAPLLPGAFGRYDWHGQLHASSQRFSCNWQRNDCQGQLEIFWRDAAVAEIPGIVLGDYRIHLTGQGEQSQIHLETLRGALQITGNGTLSARNGLDFSAQASVPGLGDAGSRILGSETLINRSDRLDQRPSPLASLLETLGRPTADGRYLLEYHQTRQDGHAPGF